MPDLIGSSIDRYRIVGPAFEGAPCVYRDEDASLQALVFVTFVDTLPAEADALQDAVRYEAGRGDLVRHSAVARVLGAFPADQGLCLVSEYAAGPTLASVLRLHLERGEQMPYPAVVALARGLAAAVDFVHEQGLVLRAVTPQNVILTTADAPVLGAYGIGPVGAEVDAAPYRAPEQADGVRGGRPGDIYALATVLFEALVGRPPWVGDSVEAVRTRQSQTPVPPVAGLSPGVPPAVQAVMERALAKDPAARYPTAGELAVALEAALTGGGSAAEAQAAPRTEVLRDSTVRNAQAPRRPRSRWRVAGIAAAVVVVLLTAFGAWRGDVYVEQLRVRVLAQHVPQRVGSTTGWAAVSAAGEHSLAVRADGTLWTWGLDYPSGLETGDPVALHRRPSRLDADRAFATVGAGQSHALALAKDGTLWSWGLNRGVSLGTGATADSSYPIELGSASDWVAVSAGWTHSLGIRADGTLWAWGDNRAGQLGDGTTTTRHSPVQVGSDADWTTASAGDQYSLALKRDGTLWAWGDNLVWQLGDGTNTDRHSPVQVGTDADWAAVSASTVVSYGIRSDGTLWVWGSGAAGSPVDGTSSNYPSPVKVGSDTDWVTVRTESLSTLGIKRDGSLWSWGLNDFGQLGDGTTTPHWTPARVGSRTDWTAVSIGYFHALALAKDGTLWAWGDGRAGQLGDGDLLDHLNPF